MRIALFTDTYPPQINGVAQTLERLVTHASQRGHAVAVVSPAVTSSASAAGAALHLRLPSWSLPFYPELRLARPMDRSAAARLEAFAPDLVHVATEFTVGWSGYTWAQAHNLPVVSSFHTDFPAYLAHYGMAGLQQWGWTYLRNFHARAARTLCPSRATLQQLRAAGFAGDIAVWSRGVDTALYAPNRRSEELRRRLAGDANVLLLYVGRVAPEKKVDLLLDAFAHVRMRFGRAVALAIVGDGPALNALRARGTEGVVFAGYLRGQALAAAYASADIFAFPSDTETFGNVVLEAAASGLAIAAPRRGGVLETVTHEHTGLLFEPGIENDFADALQRLIADPELRTRLAYHARAHAQQQSWTAVLDGVLDVYNGLLPIHVSSAQAS